MKKLIVIIFIIFGAFLTFSLYRTLAYDTSIVEETPSTTDLEYTFKIGNSIIKQITVDSGETKYYDVVLGNPNPAKISYGVYYEMVSPSSKPDGFSIEYTSKSTGESTGRIDKEGNITLNLVVTNTSSSSVTVKLGTVAGYVNGGELTLESGQEYITKKSFPKATEFVESLNDNSTGDSGSGVYKVHHDAISAENSVTGQLIEDTDDYRYYGSPDNYICLDNSVSPCEDRHLYRIIGSIYEELEKSYRIKVIKATKLTDGNSYTWLWDRTSSCSYSNVWATSTNGNYSNSLTSGSQIMKLLNSGAWWNKMQGEYYNGYSCYSSDIVKIDFTNYGLSDNAKQFISLSRYYLGTTNSYNANTSYVLERGSSSKKYWDGYVGLVYPSDYGYASGVSCSSDISNSNCEPWISKKSYDSMYYNISSISPRNESDIWSISYGNIMCKNCDKPDPMVVYPVFYLSKDVVITSGTGTEQDPYLVQ